MWRLCKCARIPLLFIFHASFNCRRFIYLFSVFHFILWAFFSSMNCIHKISSLWFAFISNFFFIFILPAFPSRLRDVSRLFFSSCLVDAWLIWECILAKIHFKRLQNHLCSRLRAPLGWDLTFFVFVLMTLHSLLTAQLRIETVSYCLLAKWND